MAKLPYLQVGARSAYAAVSGLSAGSCAHPAWHGVLDSGQVAESWTSVRRMVER